MRPVLFIFDVDVDNIVRTTFAISTALSFAAITATMMHAFLFFRKQLLSQCRRSMKEQPDIHARLMSKYKEVPEWWYGAILGASVQCGELRPNSPLSLNSVDGHIWHCVD